jgi:hypothetical protein
MELSGAAVTFKQVAVEGFFVGFPDKAAKAQQRLSELARILAEERIEQPFHLAVRPSN